MRITASLLAAALATLACPATAAENDANGVGLFSRADDSPVVVTPGVWFTRGLARTKSDASDSGDVDQPANLMATVDLDLRVPGHHWLGVWGRGAQTVYNAKGDSRTAKDVDSDFTLAEANLVLTLAGRGSPLFELETAPRSSLDLYAGARYFHEVYKAKLPGDVKREVDARWAGPQVGLRGQWYLKDTYNYGELDGWSLNFHGAVMPVMHMESTDRLDGAKAFEQKSDRAYGGEAAAGVSWRRGALTFSLGYQAQYLRADKGDEEDALGGKHDLLQARSDRYGPFAAISISF
jgi:hypothetical protein